MPPTLLRLNWRCTTGRSQVLKKKDDILDGDRPRMLLFTSGRKRRLSEESEFIAVLFPSLSSLHVVYAKHAAASLPHWSRFFSCVEQSRRRCIPRDDGVPRPFVGQEIERPSTGRYNAPSRFE